ncbi:MAG: FG-GAP repeat domain-containing protein [Pirellulaceae bacterium]
MSLRIWACCRVRMGHMVDTSNVAIRHPAIHPDPIAYPDPKTGFSNIIAGGESALYFYRFMGHFTSDGKPVYETPVPVLETDADLYAGTLPVPNVVDWDGDGDLDIVSGNSEGFILFFENIGSNGWPRYRPGERIKGGGHVIHVQPGYRLDIQGPGEARWGYVCPTVADWNGDGLLDIVMSDSTARHTVFIREGRAKHQVLGAGRPLYLDGLELQGTWRVKPGVREFGGRRAYVCLDGDDDFHLYWQEDAYHVTDGGKLTLDDSSVIRANFLHAGGTGRLKICVADWDRDGEPDLIVGYEDGRFLYYSREHLTTARPK